MKHGSRAARAKAAASRAVSLAIASAQDAVSSGFAKADQEERERRKGICKSCPGGFFRLGFCSRCFCRMDWKTRLAAMHCPEGYW